MRAAIESWPCDAVNQVTDRDTVGFVWACSCSDSRNRQKLFLIAARSTMSVQDVASCIPLLAMFITNL